MSYSERKIGFQFIEVTEELLAAGYELNSEGIVDEAHYVSGRWLESAFGPDALAAAHKVASKTNKDRNSLEHIEAWLACLDNMALPKQRGFDNNRYERAGLKLVHVIHGKHQGEPLNNYGWIPVEKPATN